MFPMAAAAAATVRYAAALETRATRALATAVTVLAIFALVVAFARNSFHVCQCLVGKQQYDDPAFRCEMYRAGRARRVSCQPTGTAEAIDLTGV